MHFLGWDYIRRDQIVPQRVYLWILDVWEDRCSPAEATEILLNPRLRLGEPLAVVMPEKIWPDGSKITGVDCVLSDSADLGAWEIDPDAGWLLIPDMDALAVRENQSPDTLLQRLRLAAWRNETTVIILESGTIESCWQERNWRHDCWCQAVYPKIAWNTRSFRHRPFRSYDLGWWRNWLAPDEHAILCNLNRHLATLENRSYMVTKAAVGRALVCRPDDR